MDKKLQIGISLYPGLDNSPKENMDLLRKAESLGFTKVFTSLHIPESDTIRLREEVNELFHLAGELGLEIISDVSPDARQMLDLASQDFEAFRRLGITSLRLDWGFTLAEMAEFTRNESGLRVQLNASAIDENTLQELQAANADFSRLDALHNFYPRTGTGISESWLVKQTQMLHRYGIRVGAFVPSMKGRRRSPLQEGLPTLERHRFFATDLAARHLQALGMDDIFISDSLPTVEELDAVADCPKRRGTAIRIVPLVTDEAVLNLLTRPFTARPDEAACCIRAQESRSLAKEIVPEIQAENTVERGLGTITIDNKNYGRYAGELQIITTPQAADPRVNVVGQIADEEQFLIKYIRPATSFQLLAST